MKNEYVDADPADADIYFEYLADLFDLLDTNSAVDRKVRRRQLRCPHCRPHRGENQGRVAKHGTKKRR